MTEKINSEKPKTEAEILLACPLFRKLTEEKTERYLGEGLSPQEAKREATLQALTVISLKAQLGDLEDSQELGGLNSKKIPQIAKQAAEIIDPSRDK